MKNLRDYIVTISIILIGVLLVSFNRQEKKAATKYIIVSHITAEYLSEQVNKKLSEGYSCVGGVTVIMRSGTTSEYLQAMEK